MSRDLAAERDLLAEAGGSDFAMTLIARIDAADVEYGDSFVWAARSLLWRELQEEAIDLGGWAVLALRRCELDGTPERDLDRLRALLLTIARHGARANVLIAEARKIAEGTS